MARSVYEMARIMYDFCDEKGLDPSICLHSTMQAGCIGCAKRWLGFKNINIASFDAEKFDEFAWPTPHFEAFLGDLRDKSRSLGDSSVHD